MKSGPYIAQSALVACLLTLGWLATARADIDNLPPVGDPRAAAGFSKQDLLQLNDPVNASALPGTPQLAVTVPPAPSSQELEKGGLYQFIVDHATVHHRDDSTARDLARWRGGKQSICPVTLGLSPGEDAFVTARIRALATFVGAPVQADPQCRDNVQIIFTNNPEERMDHVLKWAEHYFRSRFTGGTKDLIAYTTGHAVQGWYMTTTDGAAALNSDLSLLHLDVLPVWPRIVQNHFETNRTGSRLSLGSGSGIGLVILVVDTRRAASLPIGTVADYVAMLSLSVVQSPEHCDALPSILDVFSTSCAARPAPAALTAGDLAFLKAIYFKNTGLGPTLSRAEIEGNMNHQFEHR